MNLSVDFCSLDHISRVIVYRRTYVVHGHQTMRACVEFGIATRWIIVEFVVVKQQIA